MGHLTMVYLIDPVNNLIKDYVLELPVIKSVRGDCVHFSTSDLPLELEFLRHSSLAFPIHEVSQAAMEKADKVVKACKEQYDIRLARLMELEEELSPSHGFEVGFATHHTKTDAGNMSIDDLVFYETVSYSTTHSISALTNPLANCHYHPKSFDVNLAVPSPTDIKNSKHWETGILSHDNEGKLKLWFYYTIPEQYRVISVATETRVKLSEYEVNGIRVLSEELMFNKPFVIVENIKGQIFTGVSFPGSKTPANNIVSTVLEALIAKSLLRNKDTELEGLRKIKEVEEKLKEVERLLLSAEHQKSCVPEH